MELARWIEVHASRTPDKPALRWQKTNISFADLARRIERTTAALSGELGIGRGDRVAILAHNCPEYLELLFACARLGAILVTLNWRLAPPEHVQILENSGASLLICDEALTSSLADIRVALPKLRCIGLDLAQRAPVGVTAPSTGRREDPVLLVYTSGTTGQAKGAIHTQATLVANARLSVDAHEMTASDRILTFLPLFHVGGLNNQTLPALSIGATVILQPRFVPDTALDAIESERPSIVLVVPAVMSAMIAHPRWQQTDISSLRLAMTGSSVVPVELIRAFHRRGVPMGQIYGSTETGPVSIVLRREDALRKEGACGLPARDYEVRVVDEAGRDVPTGAAGEIWLKGPNITPGYWEDRRATEEAFHEGWYRTGDIGHVDEEGYFWIDERKKDMIISGGENIYPAELESVLAGCPDIAESAVVARADAKWGEVPVAVVVKRPGAEVTKESVRALFEGKLARFKHPHDVIFVDTLPRNVLGKLLRYKLRDALRQG